MESHHGSFKGVIAIIIASFLWGTTGTAASYSPDVSSFAIGAFSMGIGECYLLLQHEKRYL
ncbi:hypothetical protein P4S81_20745 [Pseudoalteromonas sp. B28]